MIDTLSARSASAKILILSCVCLVGRVRIEADSANETAGFL